MTSDRRGSTNFRKQDDMEERMQNKEDVKSTEQRLSSEIYRVTNSGPLIYLMQSPVELARFNVLYHRKIRWRCKTTRYRPMQLTALMP